MLLRDNYYILWSCSIAALRPGNLKRVAARAMVRGWFCRPGNDPRGRKRRDAAGRRRIRCSCRRRDAGPGRLLSTRPDGTTGGGIRPTPWRRGRYLYHPRKEKRPPPPPKRRSEGQNHIIKNRAKKKKGVPVPSESGRRKLPHTTKIERG